MQTRSETARADAIRRAVDSQIYLNGMYCVQELMTILAQHLAGRPVVRRGQ